MSNRAGAIQKEPITRHEKTEKLKILDVYWSDEVFGKDNRIRILPINIEKSLIIETNIPKENHEKKVEVKFLISGSVLDKELSNIIIDTYKDTVTLTSSGEERYRFEIKNATHDLINL